MQALEIEDLCVQALVVFLPQTGIWAIPHGFFEEFISKNTFTTTNHLDPTFHCFNKLIHETEANRVIRADRADLSRPFGCQSFNEVQEPMYNKNMKLFFFRSGNNEGDCRNWVEIRHPSRKTTSELL